MVFGIGLIEARQVVFFDEFQLIDDGDDLREDVGPYLLEVLDILSHDITVHEDGLSTFAKSNPIALDHVHFDDHTKMRDEFEMQHKLYTEMKRKFLRFLTEVM